MPLPVPSATGLAKAGNGKRTPAMSSGRSTIAKSGVGTPASRTTNLVNPLCRQTPITTGSENVYGVS